MRNACTSLTLASVDWSALLRPVTMLMARPPPLTAPQMPPVFAMPPHSPVAILGINSDWIPRLSAMACKTLSAQQNPRWNSVSLRWATWIVVITAMAFSLNLPGRSAKTSHRLQAQCPPATVYPARRKSSAKSFSICAAAALVRNRVQVLV
jgi:hypothetical protein